MQLPLRRPPSRTNCRSDHNDQEHLHRHPADVRRHRRWPRNSWSPHHPSRLPDHRQPNLGQAYSKTVATTAGTLRYKSKEASKLPKGLKLKAAGVISGTPKLRG